MPKTKKKRHRTRGVKTQIIRLQTDPVGDSGTTSVMNNAALGEPIQGASSSAVDQQMPINSTVTNALFVSPVVPQAQQPFMQLSNCSLVPAQASGFAPGMMPFYVIQNGPNATVVQNQPPNQLQITPTGPLANPPLMSPQYPMQISLHGQPDPSGASGPHGGRNVAPAIGQHQPPIEEGQTSAQFRTGEIHTPQQINLVAPGNAVGPTSTAAGSGLTQYTSNLPSHLQYVLGSVSPNASHPMLQDNQLGGSSAVALPQPAAGLEPVRRLGQHGQSQAMLPSQPSIQYPVASNYGSRVEDHANKRYNADSNLNSPPQIASTGFGQAGVNGVFGWAGVDGVSIPYLFRDGKKFVSVRTVEQKLLCKYPSSYPAELGQMPPLMSVYMTTAEAQLLNEINEQHRGRGLEQKSFTTQDLIVRLADFEVFYSTVQKHFPSPTNHHGSGRVPPDLVGGWLQVNNTLIPYISRSNLIGTKLVPLSVVKYGAGLLKNEEVTGIVATEEECHYLTSTCQRVGLTLKFNVEKARLVDINLLPMICKQSLTITELPKDDPFGYAEYKDIVDDGDGLEQSGVQTEIRPNPNQSLSITHAQVPRSLPPPMMAAPNVTVHPWSQTNLAMGTPRSFPPVVPCSSSDRHEMGCPPPYAAGMPYSGVAKHPVSRGRGTEGPHEFNVQTNTNASKCEDVPNSTPRSQRRKRVSDRRTAPPPPYAAFSPIPVTSSPEQMNARQTLPPNYHLLPRNPFPPCQPRPADEETLRQGKQESFPSPHAEEEASTWKVGSALVGKVANSVGLPRYATDSDTLAAIVNVDMLDSTVTESGTEANCRRSTEDLITPMEVDGKYISCLIRQPGPVHYVLVEAIGRVYFPGCSLQEFRHALEEVLMVELEDLRQEEQDAFIAFYGLQVKTLNCNKAMSLTNLHAYLPQLRYIFQTKSKTHRESSSTVSSPLKLVDDHVKDNQSHIFPEKPDVGPSNSIPTAPLPMRQKTNGRKLEAVLSRIKNCQQLSESGETHK